MCSWASRSVNQSEWRLIRSLGCGAEQCQDRLQRFMHHPALLDRIDTHHVGVRRQGARTGTEHHPPAGQVIQQHPAVGHHQRMVVGQRYHTGAQPDVLGPLGRRGDEHLRAGDQLVAAGVVLSEPRFVEAQTVQGNHSLHVVFECCRGGLAGRVKRCDENTEVQRAAHHSSAVFKPTGSPAPPR